MCSSGSSSLLSPTSSPWFSSCDSLPDGWEVKHHTSFISRWPTKSKFFLFAICAFAEMHHSKGNIQRASEHWTLHSRKGRMRSSSPAWPWLLYKLTWKYPGRDERKRAQCAIQLGIISFSFSRAQCHCSKATTFLLKKEIPAQNTLSNVLWLKLPGLFCLYHLLMQSCKFYGFVSMS